MDSDNNQHQRREDAEPMQKTWRRIRPYWHIGTTILLAIIGTGVGGVIWVTNVNALPQQIKDLNTRVVAVETKVQTIDVVNQRVNDIADFMGVPKYKRNHNVENNQN